MKRAVLFTLIFFVLIAGFVFASALIRPNASLPFGTSPTKPASNDLSAGNGSSGLVLSQEEVAKHDNSSDCWMIIGGKVYDLTDYISLHPGGVGDILKYCGADGTEAYQTQDRPRGGGHSAYADSLLADYLLGDVGGGTTSPGGENPTAGTNQTASTQAVNSGNSSGNQDQGNSASAGIMMSDVAAHSTKSDCWMVIEGKVYDVTEFFGMHPGGDAMLLSSCGKDGTAAYNGQGHSSRARDMLAAYYVGELASLAGQADNVSQQSSPVSQNNSNVNSIDKEYPGAVILEENKEDDGRAEIKFLYEGKKYQAKLDKDGSIVKVEED